MYMQACALLPASCAMPAYVYFLSARATRFSSLRVSFQHHIVIVVSTPHPHRLLHQMTSSRKRIFPFIAAFFLRFPSLSFPLSFCRIFPSCSAVSLC
jgi:hypothetical protein